MWCELGNFNNYIQQQVIVNVHTQIKEENENDVDRLVSTSVSRSTEHASGGVLSNTMYSYLMAFSQPL